MCGLFGYISDTGVGPDMDKLSRIARVTESRGRDAHGWAWISQDGRIHSYKQSGPVSLNLGKLHMLANARMIVGHCRAVTRGSPLIQSNNHPHPCDGGWIVHNGKVTNDTEIVKALKLNPTSECDSEVLGLSIAALEGSLLNRIAATIDLVPQKLPLAFMGLWSKPSRLAIVRRGHPLHIAYTPNGSYLASLADGMPVGVQAIKEGTCFIFGQQKRYKNNATIT